MSLFTSSQATVAETVYEKCKKHLKERDGNVHLLMINSFSKFLNQNFECESKYTTQLNVILDGLQNDGYEIIDIKFNSLMNQGITGTAEGFHTIIIYK